MSFKAWHRHKSVIEDATGGAMTFDDPARAHLWLEGRGYFLLESGNWLPPNSLREPSGSDRAAAACLEAGIVILRSCPFCGGRGDPYGPLGVVCVDCGALAIDVGRWQQRV